MDNNHLPHEIYDLTLDTSNDQGTYIQPENTWKNPTGQLQTQFPTWTSGDVTSMSHQTTNQGIVENSPLDPSQLSMMSNALYVGRPERAQLGTMNSVLQRENGPNFYADIRSHGPLTEPSGHAYSQAGDFLQLQLPAGAPTSYGTTGGAASAYTGSEYAGSVVGSKRGHAASIGGESERRHKRVAHSVSNDIGCISSNSAMPRASAKKSLLEPPFMNAVITQAKIPKPGRPPGTGMNDLSNKHKTRHSKKRPEMERKDVKMEDALLSNKGGKRDEKSNKHRFPCDICDKALTSDNDLVRHRVTEHNLAKEGALIWDCGYGCGRYSGLNPRKDNFKQHMKNKHHIDTYLDPQALSIYERRITSDNAKIMKFFDIETPSIMQLLDTEHPDAVDDLSIDLTDEDPPTSSSSSQNKPSIQENDEQPKLVVGSIMSQMSEQRPQEEQLPSACTNTAEQIPDDWAVLDGSGNMFRAGDGYMATEEEFYIPDQDEILELEGSVESSVVPVVVPNVIRDVKVQVSREPLDHSILDWATLEKMRKAGFSLLRKDPNGGPSILYE